MFPFDPTFPPVILICAAVGIPGGLIKEELKLNVCAPPPR
jgi:hypothetical protein